MPLLWICSGEKPASQICLKLSGLPKVSTKTIRTNSLLTIAFNWKKKLDDATIERFQRELGAMGYKFQFITLARFHALNYSMFDLARGYKERGMSAYSDLQEAEFAAEADGYTAIRHQR